MAGVLGLPGSAPGGISLMMLFGGRYQSITLRGRLPYLCQAESAGAARMEAVCRASSATALVAPENLGRGRAYQGWIGSWCRKLLDVPHVPQNRHGVALLLQPYAGSRQATVERERPRPVWHRQHSPQQLCTAQGQGSSTWHPLPTLLAVQATPSWAPLP